MVRCSEVLPIHESFVIIASAGDGDAAKQATKMYLSQRRKASPGGWRTSTTHHAPRTTHQAPRTTYHAPRTRSGRRGTAASRTFYEGLAGIRLPCCSTPCD
ncbi:hypothetical protein BS17DRAFT_813972 [Gyrodon lividus]|nr:hypothetical protein BS17DRAFT_813972 [Gyrodon lividus]